MKKHIIVDMAYKHEGLRFYEDECPTLNSRDYKEPKCVMITEEIKMGGVNQINPSKISGGKQPYQQDRVYDTNGIMPTLSKGNGGNTIPKIQVKSNTKQGYEEAQPGDSINFSMPNSKTRRGRVGVGVGVGVAQTLETQVTQSVLLEGNIRRLTEVECERLQGFTDNHTKYGNYDGVVKEISATQRYKQSGNAVSTVIVELIGIKLLKQLTNGNEHM